MAVEAKVRMPAPRRTGSGTHVTHVFRKPGLNSRVESAHLYLGRGTA
jgi:hypothetical protein